MKRRIQLTEQGLHRLIKESVNRLLKESEDYAYTYIGSIRIPGEYLEKYLQRYDTNMEDLLINKFTNFIEYDEINFSEGNVGFADQYCTEFDLEGEHYEVYRDRNEDEFFVVKKNNESMNDDYDM